MRNSLSLFMLLLVVVFVTGCADRANSPDQTGTLQISLTDAPAAFDAVNITFSEISAHIDSQWITVRRDPMTVDLLQWNNGQSIVIGTADIPAGHYTQIRLKIQDANIVVDGQTLSLDVPSGAQSGLKLVHQFTIDPGSTYDLIIDFDAQRSIVATGPPNNPTGYKLKPTLRVVPRAITGSVSGTVSNPESLPVVFAIAGTDTVTAAAVNGSSGYFMLAYLPQGAYSVAISDMLGRSGAVSNVNVVAGTDKNVGQITLQ